MCIRLSPSMPQHERPLALIDARGRSHQLDPADPRCSRGGAEMNRLSLTATSERGVVITCRLLRRVRERISSRAAIASTAGVAFLGGAAVIFGGAAPAFGGSASHAQQDAAAHSAATASSPWPGGVWQPGPAKYGVGQQLNVSFRMPDGTVLAGNDDPDGSGHGPEGGRTVSGDRHNEPLLQHGTQHRPRPSFLHRRPWLHWGRV